MFTRLAMYSTGHINKNTCFVSIVCSLSTTEYTCTQRNLCDYMDSSMLYPNMKSDFLDDTFKFVETNFTTTCRFLPGHINKNTFVFSLFLYQSNVTPV